MAGLCSVPWGWRRQAQNRLYTLGGARTGGDLFSPQPHSRPSALGGAGQKGLPAPAGAAATGDLAAGEGPAELPAVCERISRASLGATGHLFWSLISHSFMQSRQEPLGWAPRSGLVPHRSPKQAGGAACGKGILARSNVHNRALSPQVPYGQRHGPALPAERGGPCPR